MMFCVFFKLVNSFIYRYSIRTKRVQSSGLFMYADLLKKIKDV